MNSDLRAQFPIFQQKIHDKSLVYLDSAASTQKPEIVINAMNEIYRTQYSNVHRGVHYLSQNLSQRYENTREIVRKFINAPRTEEIVFTKGTTEALNLLAHSLSAFCLQKDDVILLSALEHHANIVPWQQAAQKYQAQIRIIPMNDAGELILDDLENLLAGVKILSLTWVSNALGTVNPVEKIIAAARKKGIFTIIDAAQAVAHLPVDVKKLDCDFLVFSGHKIYAPTGIGVLYGRYELLEALPPYQTGGDMILSVSFNETIFAPPPLKFEAGTPPIVEVIALGSALEWFMDLNLEQIWAQEEALRLETEHQLKQFADIKIIGQAENKVAVTSFVIDGIHPHDVGTIVDSYGVALRVGHHCAEPVMQRLGVNSTIRASFALYNNQQDIKVLLEALQQVRKLFA